MPIRNISLSLLTAALLATVSTADARGRKFSCPLPDKRACMSTQQVYDATDNGGNLDDLLEEQSQQRRRDRKSHDAVIEPVMQAKPPEFVGGTPVSNPNRCCSPTNTEVTIKGDTLAVASPASYPSQPTSVAMVSYAASSSPYGASGAVNTPGVVYASYPAAQMRREEMVVRSAGNEAFRMPAKVLRIYISPWEDEQGDLHMGGYVFSEVAPRKWSVGARAVSADSGYRLLHLNSPARDAAQDAKPNEGDATAQVSRTE